VSVVIRNHVKNQVPGRNHPRSSAPSCAANVTKKDFSRLQAGRV